MKYKWKLEGCIKESISDDPMVSADDQPAIASRV
jgi:hypothetical protein